MRWGGKPILLNGTVERDPEVLELLEKYKPAVYKLIENVVGASRVRLDASECRALECNAGNMIADAHIYTRVNQYTANEKHFWTDASISFVQGGGVRSSIEMGNITYADLLSVLPFNNTLMVVQITGAGLLQAFEHAVEQYTQDRGEFLQVSGARVVYDLRKPSGSRVVSVEVRCSECDVPSYSELDPTKMYGTIMSNFLYDGGDGFTMFKVSLHWIHQIKCNRILLCKFNFQDLKAESMDILEFEAVHNYIQNVHTVYPAIEGRVTLIPDNSNDINKPGSASRSTVSMSVIFITIVTIFSYFQ